MCIDFEWTIPLTGQKKACFPVFDKWMMLMMMMLTPHCWQRSCATWFWARCRSRSRSGTGRTPCAGSGGRRDGAPTQDSPANPWDCGLARDHSPHRSWGRERRAESGRLQPVNHRVSFLKFSREKTLNTHSHTHTNTQHRPVLFECFWFLGEEAEGGSERRCSHTAVILLPSNLSIDD